MRAATGRTAFVAATAIICLIAMACGGGTKQHNQVQAAMDSLVQQQDSTRRIMDSGHVRVVDTTKLGAAKTESILTVQRKKP